MLAAGLRYTNRTEMQVRVFALFSSLSKKIFGPKGVRCTLLDLSIPERYYSLYLIKNSRCDDHLKIASHMMYFAISRRKVDSKNRP